MHNHGRPTRCRRLLPFFLSDCLFFAPRFSACASQCVVKLCRKYSFSSLSDRLGSRARRALAQSILSVIWSSIVVQRLLETAWTTVASHFLAGNAEGTMGCLSTGGSNRRDHNIESLGNGGYRTCFGRLCDCRYKRSFHLEHKTAKGRIARTSESMRETPD
jgi:hypothetical protein